jgi:hypothetical protein
MSDQVSHPHKKKTDKIIQFSSFFYSSWLVRAVGQNN